MTGVCEGELGFLLKLETNMHFQKIAITICALYNHNAKCFDSYADNSLFGVSMRDFLSGSRQVSGRCSHVVNVAGLTLTLLGRQLCSSTQR